VKRASSRKGLNDFTAGIVEHIWRKFTKNLFEPLPEQKQRAVAAFKLRHTDLTGDNGENREFHFFSLFPLFAPVQSLTEAHVGILFRAPDNVKRQSAQFKAVETYGELMGLVKTAMG